MDIGFQDKRCGVIDQGLYRSAEPELQEEEENEEGGDNADGNFAGLFHVEIDSEEWSTESERGTRDEGLRKGMGGIGGNDENGAFAFDPEIVGTVGQCVSQLKDDDRPLGDTGFDCDFDGGRKQSVSGGISGKQGCHIEGGEVSGQGGDFVCRGGICVGGLLIVRKPGAIGATLNGLRRSVGGAGDCFDGGGQKGENLRRAEGRIGCIGEIERFRFCAGKGMVEAVFGVGDCDKRRIGARGSHPERSLRRRGVSGVRKRGRFQIDAHGMKGNGFVRRHWRGAVVEQSKQRIQEGIDGGRIGGLPCGTANVPFGRRVGAFKSEGAASRKERDLNQVFFDKGEDAAFAQIVQRKEQGIQENAIDGTNETAGKGSGEDIARRCRIGFSEDEFGWSRDIAMGDREKEDGFVDGESVCDPCLFGTAGEIFLFFGLRAIGSPEKTMDGRVFEVFEQSGDSRCGSGGFEGVCDGPDAGLVGFESHRRLVGASDFDGGDGGVLLSEERSFPQIIQIRWNQIEGGPFNDEDIGTAFRLEIDAFARGGFVSKTEDHGKSGFGIAGKCKRCPGISEAEIGEIEFPVFADARGDSFVDDCVSDRIEEQIDSLRVGPSGGGRSENPLCVVARQLCGEVSGLNVEIGNETQMSGEQSGACIFPIVFAKTRIREMQDNQKLQEDNEQEDYRFVGEHRKVFSIKRKNPMQMAESATLNAGKW